MTFAELVGKGITLSVPKLSSKSLISAALVGVESSGLWITGPDLNQAINKSVGIMTGEKRTTSAVFVPFSEIAFVTAVTADTPKSRV